VNNTEENKYKYARLPIEKNNKNWKWEGNDFRRVISLLEFEEFISSNNLSFEKALGLNGENDPEFEFVSCRETTIVRYEDDIINHDLHNLNLPCKDYDFVMINQTLEHVYNPILCLQNAYSHMRKGGILYANVPANNIPHSTPHHFYTGITATGLGAMAKTAGFEILKIGQWGNYEYLQKIFSTHDWPDYRMLANPGINEFENPVDVWIFAIKEK